MDFVVVAKVPHPPCVSAYCHNLTPVDSHLKWRKSEVFLRTVVTSTVKTVVYFLQG